MDDKKKLDNMDNNSLLFYIKQLESDHESIKLRMILDFDKLVEIEKSFDQANRIILKRLKGE
jgi:hypothetical protein